MKLDNFFRKTISFLFAALFFLIPIVFTPVNSELFEFNKIILLYLCTILITAFWLARMIIQQKIVFRKTFLDLPLILFLASQIISTLVSIDSHTSIFGYYSRFNGGLLSTLCYLLLYFAFVSNSQPQDVNKLPASPATAGARYPARAGKFDSLSHSSPPEAGYSASRNKILKVSLASAFIVSIYGVFEHFGYSFSCLIFQGKFDVSCWVQDVQTRVFATLGQPNWLAAYLAILIPLTWWLALNSKFKSLPQAYRGVKSAKLKLPVKNFWPYVLFIILSSCLLSTKSRSGILGLVLSVLLFWGALLLVCKSNRKILLKPFLIFNFSLLILSFLFGFPFSQLNQYLRFMPSMSNNLTPPATKQQSDTQIAVGGTESSAIRKIVWKGALDIFRHYPLFGSGVETFAYSYYQFRPAAHNLVSEWDFLYNKAHNEYLNYLSTTGILGLGSYLLLIILFITWSLVQCKVQSAKCKVEMQNSKLDKQKLLTFNCNFELLTLNFALFSGWLSLLVTNFFGFSVVVTSLYFFLIPAFCVVLISHISLPNPNPASHLPSLTSQPQSSFSPPISHFSSLPLPFVLLIFATFYLLLATINYWRADFFYAKSQKLAKQGNYPDSYQNLYRAKNFFPNEPVYLSEISSVTANLALMAAEQKQSSAAGELEDLAISYSEQAKNISPKNLNVLKTRVRVFYLLSLLKPDYLAEAIDTLRESIKLAPTDPKLVYNLGLLYAKMNNSPLAIQTIEKAIQLKPDYVDARNALELIYEETGDKQKAIEQLQILIKLAPENATEFQKKLDQLK